MLQLRVPKKLMATIQTWGCLLLAVLCVIFSFTPLFTLKTIDNAEEIEASLNEVFKEADIQVEIPEKIGISAIKLIKSVALIIDVVDVTKDIAKAEMQEDDDLTDVMDELEGDDVSNETEKEEIDANAKVKELEELLKSETSQETLITAFAIVTTVSSAFENDSKEDGALDFLANLISSILPMLIVIAALLYVLGFTLVFPFVFTIGTVITLIKVIAHKNDPFETAPIAAKRLNGIMTLPLLSMLFQCVIPGINLGFGTVAIFILACIGIVINVAISRTRDYPEDKNIFSLIVQGGALIGAIGFAVYFFSIINTGILNTFLHGNWGLYAAEVASIKALNESAEVSNAFLIDGILILLYASFVMSSINYFTGCVQRLTLTGSRGKRGADAPAHLIPMAAIVTIGTIIPFVVAGMKNLYEDPTNTSNGAFTSLALKGDGKTALIVALIGVIIMLAAEIAIVVCMNTYCKDLSKRTKQEILMGEVTLDAEKAPAAVEEKTAEAPAQEAAKEADKAPAKEEDKTPTK